MVDQGEGYHYMNNDNGDEDDAGGLLGFYAYLNTLTTNSNSNQQQIGGDENSIEVKGPLGLKLKKTPSFVSLIEQKLSEANKRKNKTNEGSQNPSRSCKAKMDNFVSQSMSEKLKASNFPALALKIGSWERISSHEGDLIAKCYYAKRKLVWEVLEGALKSKIEMQWSDIVGIRAVIRDNENGLLEIEICAPTLLYRMSTEVNWMFILLIRLNQPPSYFREIDPQPRKHTLWKVAFDFTGGQAPICRRHSAIFPPGYLDKHYEKLLQCDPRLLMLSQQPFPTQESPYFLRTIYESLDFNRYGLPYRVPSFPNLPMPACNQVLVNNQGLANNLAKRHNEIGMSNFGFPDENYSIIGNNGGYDTHLGVSPYYELLSHSAYKEHPQLSHSLAHKEQPQLSPELAYKEQPQLSHPQAYKEQPQLSPELAYKEQPQLSPELAYKEQTQLSPELAYKEQPQLSHSLAYKERPQLYPYKEQPQLSPELAYKEWPQLYPYKEQPQLSPELAYKEQPQLYPYKEQPQLSHSLAYKERPQLYPYKEQPQLSHSLAYKDQPQISPGLSPELPLQLYQNSNLDMIINESEPSMEDFAALDAMQDICPWT